MGSAQAYDKPLNMFLSPSIQNIFAVEIFFIIIKKKIFLSLKKRKLISFWAKKKPRACFLLPIRTITRTLAHPQKEGLKPLVVDFIKFDVIKVFVNI